MRTRAQGHLPRNGSPCGKGGESLHNTFLILLGKGDSGSAESISTVTFVIMSPCIGVKDGTCVDVCPVDCIHEGETMFYIDPEECIACALCETVCPVDAIRHIDDMPQEEQEYIAKNADFFKSNN